MAIRILVVGDHPGARKETSQALSFRGYAVTAVSGTHAVTAVQGAPPDVVLTDVVMPDKCGIELIREIKRANREIRIIAASAGGLLDRGYILELARKSGADLVLPKPYTLDELLAAIAQILERDGGDPMDAP